MRELHGGEAELLWYEPAGLEPGSQDVHSAGSLGERLRTLAASPTAGRVRSCGSRSAPTTPASR
jgi:hypothetical protein